MAISISEKNFKPCKLAQILKTNMCVEDDYEVTYSLKERPSCPDCGAELKKAGSYKRIYRTGNESKILVKILRYKCTNPDCPAVKRNRCHRATHSIFPEGLLPYAHYLPAFILFCLFMTQERYSDFFSQVLNSLKQQKSTIIYDTVTYFTQIYAPNTVKRWKEQCLFILLNSTARFFKSYQNYKSKGRKFRLFKMVSKHVYKPPAIEVIPGTYFIGSSF